jgi:hypothetical protein
MKRVKPQPFPYQRARSLAGMRHKEAAQFFSGYVDREGHFYPCGYSSHYLLAEKIHRQLVPALASYAKSEAFLDELGWIKLSDGRFYYFADIDLLMTEAQVKFLLAYNGDSDTIHYNCFRIPVSKFLVDVAE